MSPKSLLSLRSLQGDDPFYGSMDSSIVQVPSNAPTALSQIIRDFGEYRAYCDPDFGYVQSFIDLLSEMWVFSAYN